MYYQDGSTHEAEVGECLRGMSYLTVNNTKHLIRLGVVTMDPGESAVAAPRFDYGATDYAAEAAVAPETAAAQDSAKQYVASAWDKVTSLLPSAAKPAAVAPDTSRFDYGATDYAAEAAAYSKAHPKKDAYQWTNKDAEAIGKAAATGVILGKSLRTGAPKPGKFAYSSRPSLVSPLVKSLLLGGALAGAGMLFFSARRGTKLGRAFRRARYHARRAVRKYSRRRRR
jgi:hypothetical protein